MRGAQKGTADRRVDPPAAIVRLAFPRLRPELRAYLHAERADAREHQLRTRKRRRLLAITVCRLAHQRRKAGLSAGKALKNCALPVDQLVELFEQQHGYRPARSTIQEDLRALFGGYHAGILPQRLGTYHGKTIILSPGFTYDLRVIAITLSRHGRLLLQWLRTELSKCTPTYPSCGSKHIGPISEGERVDRRVRGALEWAISHAEGQRNNVGNVLAWVLRREIGLERHEVEAVMDKYQQHVEWWASPSYTRREAMATVRSVFRRG